MPADRQEENSNNATDLFKRGTALYDKGKIVDGIQTVELALDSDPDNDSIINYLFICHFQEGFKLFNQQNLDGAIEHFERANTLLPGHDQTRLNLTILYNQKGTALYESGRLEEAAPIFRQSLEMTPQNPLATTYLFTFNLGKALIYINNNQLDKAMEHFECADSLIPGHEQTKKGLNLIYSHKGMVLFTMGKIDEARAFFMRALAFNPDNELVKNYLFSIYFHLGVKFTSQQDMGEALKCFQSAFTYYSGHDAKNRDISYHAYQLGLDHFGKAEHSDAILYFKQAATIKVNDDDLDTGLIKNIYLHWFMSALNAEQYDDFISFCRKNLLGNPHPYLHARWMAESCREVATLLQNNGTIVDLIPFLQQIVRLFPSDVASHNRLGECLLAIDEPVKSIRHYALSIKCDPSQTEPSYRISQVLLLIKGPAAAAKYCRYVLKKQPNNILVIKGSVSIEQFFKERPALDFPYYPYPRYYVDKPTWIKFGNSNRSRPHSREKIRVLCYGPCQGLGISRFLEPLLKPVVDAKIFYINSGLLHQSELLIRRYAKYADVAVYRKLSSSSASPEEIASYAALQEELTESSVKISFPPMENWGLWPINIFQNRIDTGKSVLELLRSGCAFNEIVRAYNAGELDFDFSKRFRESMAIMKFTERYTDIKVHDYINSNVKEKVLFTYGTHPAKSLYVECVRQIYQMMHTANIVSAPLSADGLSIYDSWPDDAIHPAEFFPIDKYAHKHFGFTWCSAESISGASRYYHIILQIAQSVVISSMQK